MKVVLNYDPNTGYISDMNGIQIVVWAGLVYGEVDTQSTNTTNSNKAMEVCTLKSAGFKLEDILQLKKDGIL